MDQQAVLCLIHAIPGKPICLWFIKGNCQRTPIIYVEQIGLLPLKGPYTVSVAISELTYTENLRHYKLTDTKMTYHSRAHLRHLTSNPFDGVWMKQWKTWIAPETKRQFEIYAHLRTRRPMFCWVIQRKVPARIDLSVQLVSYLVRKTYLPSESERGGLERLHDLDLDISLPLPVYRILNS